MEGVAPSSHAVQARQVPVDPTHPWRKVMEPPHHPVGWAGFQGQLRTILPTFHAVSCAAREDSGPKCYGEVPLEEYDSPTFAFEARRSVHLRYRGMFVGLLGWVRPTFQRIFCCRRLRPSEKPTRHSRRDSNSQHDVRSIAACPINGREHDCQWS